MSAEQLNWTQLIFVDLAPATAPVMAAPAPSGPQPPPKRTYPPTAGATCPLCGGHVNGSTCDKCGMEVDL